MYFEQLVNEKIDERQQGNRINIPDLIIGLCQDYYYAKENVKEMLTELFYERGNSYFFERGSQFLIDNAFKLPQRNKPEAYYLKLEGAWRTSLVRYGDQTKDVRR
jgi:phage anti-repressor protein